MADVDAGQHLRRGEYADVAAIAAALFERLHGASSRPLILDTEACGVVTHYLLSRYYSIGPDALDDALTALLAWAVPDASTMAMACGVLCRHGRATRAAELLCDAVRASDERHWGGAQLTTVVAHIEKLLNVQQTRTLLVVADLPPRVRHMLEQRAAIAVSACAGNTNDSSRDDMAVTQTGRSPAAVYMAAPPITALLLLLLLVLLSGRLRPVRRWLVGLLRWLRALYRRA